MGRFLTPSKITLLVLALVYADGAVSLSSSTAVLTFIVTNVLPEFDKRGPQPNEFSVGLTITQFESTLSKHASIVPGRSVWDLLLKRLWAIDCSDAIDAFVTSLPTLLAKSRDQLIRERDTGEVSEQSSGKIVRTSPLGAFIRRCHLEYTRLQFHDSILIWQDLIAYRAPTRFTYEKKNPTDARSLLDANLSDFGIDSSHPLARIMFGRLTEHHQNHGHPNHSTHDADKLLEFQVAEMQKLGGRLPEDMRRKLYQMSNAGATLPKLAHYLKFLDAWRAGDFASAFDNLHRYFDYTMQTRDRTFYQYALLNLAILQADFGCYSEAVPAMQEAIATARENKDTTCLNFCMSWLYHFGRSFPAHLKEIRENGILGSEVEGLAFLKARARDAEMWNLLSTSLLSEAKLTLQHGESIALAFENIVKASYINSVKSLTGVIGPALLMKGSLFIRVGQTHMAELCSEIFLQCYAANAPVEDILKCHFRLAHLLAMKGRYSDAEKMLMDVPSRVLEVLKYRKYWDFQSNSILLKRFLRQGDLDAAELLVRRLKESASEDVESQIAMGFYEIDYYTRKGDTSQAFALVEDLVEKAAGSNNDVMIMSKLLALKAGLLSKTGRPLKGFSIIMRAAGIAYNARMLPALWDAIIVLVNILNEVQEFTASRRLLEACLPQIFECEDCELAARAHCMLADSHMGLAGLEPAKSLSRKEHVSIAMDHIIASFEQFKFIEDLNGQLEMLAKKARIQHMRGDLVVANDTASQYLEIRKKYIEARN